MKNLTDVSLDELKANLVTLATASEHPLAVMEKNEAGELVPRVVDNFKAIVNNKTREMAAAASPGYVLKQHKEFFGAGIDAMRELSKGNVRAALWEYKSVAWMSIVFPELVIDDGEAGIEAGFFFKNSFNKTTCLTYGGMQSKKEDMKIEFFGRCISDGTLMVMPISMSDLEAFVVMGAVSGQGDAVAVTKAKVKTEAMNCKVRHYGKNTDIKLEAVKMMLMRLPAVCQAMGQKVKSLKEISVSQQNAEALLGELGFADRVKKKIIQNYFDEETKWGLYKSISRYASFEEKVSYQNMENVLNKAKRILE